MKDIEKIDKRFDILESKLDQIAKKMGMYPKREANVEKWTAIRPFDEDERNRANKRKEINKNEPDYFDGK